MFRDRRGAENVYNSMPDRGYTPDEINMVMSKETHDKYFSDDLEETKIGNKATAGTGTGLAGAGAGGITGRIIGALVGWGIPKERAKLYESSINDGHIVMGVKPKNEEDAEYFERNWHKNDGQEMHR